MTRRRRKRCEALTILASFARTRSLCTLGAMIGRRESRDVELLYQVARLVADIAAHELTQRHPGTYALGGDKQLRKYRDLGSNVVPFRRRQ
jgi:hypothetical protein